MQGREEVGGGGGTEWQKQGCDIHIHTYFAVESPSWFVRIVAIKTSRLALNWQLYTSYIDAKRNEHPDLD